MKPTLKQRAALRRNKYGNKPVYVDGIRFASKLEAKRWSELKLLERAGEIMFLKRQDIFPLVVGGTKIGTYVADFTFLERHEGGWRKVVEDAKGRETRDFKIKWTLAQVLNPFRIFRLYPPRQA